MPPEPREPMVIDVAKIFPDPEMGLGVSQVDVSRRGNPTMLGAQLGVPIELGGKRRARVAVARAGMEAAMPCRPQASITAPILTR